MKIIKKENGNIEILDNEGNIAHVITGGCCVTMTPKCQDDILQLFVGGQYINIPVADVTATQLEPAAEVPFSGDIFALIALLSADFFFELAGGGGGAGIGFYPSGQWNTLYKGTTFALWAGASLNTLSYLSITVLSEITIDKIRFLTNNSAAGQLAIGLYDISLNKITDVAFNTALPAGTQVLNLSAPVTLQAGTYFWLFSSTAAIQIGIISEDNLQLLGHDTNNGAVGRRFLTPYVHAFPMPDPAPTPTSFDNLDFRFLIQAYIV